MSDTTADTPTPPDPLAVDAESVAVADSESAPVDLGAIERDLAAVEAALPRLDDGSYWVDEVTGDEIPDGALAENPVARRA